jgi:hypothetical protein
LRIQPFRRAKVADSRTIRKIFRSTLVQKNVDLHPHPQISHLHPDPQLLGPPPPDRDQKLEIVRETEISQKTRSGKKIHLISLPTLQRKSLLVPHDLAKGVLALDETLSLLLWKDRRDWTQKMKGVGAKDDIANVNVTGSLALSAHPAIGWM